MKSAALVLGLVFICCSQLTAEGQLEVFPEPLVQSECRDRYFWIQVASGETPRFEAVDENGVHLLSEQLASHCGYTISNFNMDGFSTFRASYYSCFTLNQNDEVFTFRFNVMVTDGGGQWISRPVSAVCSGLTWTHREIICEEDYMEVNVNRESTCDGGHSGQMWQVAFAQAQKTASSVWQLMFLHSDGQVSSMSISEAQKLGYSLAASSQRVVLRSLYKQPQAEVKMVEDVPVEAVRVSVFFKQKLMVLMIDVSMACTLNSGTFEGGWLLWDVPQVLSPLVGEGAGFESRGVRLGVEGLLLDESTVANRGFSMIQRGHLIQIGVPFGAEGGYRKSLVANNAYKEMYVIFLMYEHVFSLLYEDGSSIDTKHRMLRVLETPLLCHSPFSIDQTMRDDQVFTIYLGNIPSDVLLDNVWINGRQLRVSDGSERGFTVSPVVHANGSRAYELRLPFEDPMVHQTYLGQGVVQYSADINFTLAIVPQRDSYYHNTFITAQVFNAFPPEITAQCSDRGISFSVAGPPQTRSLWEVGVDHEPLTSQLADERGYVLYNDSQRTSLEVPVFSVGYAYEDINLSNFYGTFNLLLRDSKTLEVQTSTSKRCLFKTQDMIVCSTDGIMTVVTTLAATWPTVHSERTTLLDPACGPKQIDGSRVLFEFRLVSCGTRAKVGESYMVYENEILHDRQLIADGPNFISRESQFRLTVRCFYPLSAVNRLSVDRVFKSQTPGFGSVNIFKSLKDSNGLPAQECLPGHTLQTPAAGGAKPQPSHLLPAPSAHNRPSQFAQNPQTFPKLDPSAPQGSNLGTHQVALQASTHPGHYTPQAHDQHAFGSPTGVHNAPPGYDQLLDISLQVSNPSKQSLNFVVRGENMDLADPNQASAPGSSRRIHNPPVVRQLQIESGSSGQTATLQGPNGLGNVWRSDLQGNRPTHQHQPSQDPQSLKVDMQTLTQPTGVNMELSLYGSSGGRVEMDKLELTPGNQPQSSPFHQVLQPQAQYMPNPSGTYVSDKHTGSRDTQRSTSNGPMFSTASLLAGSFQETPGAIERRNTDMFPSKVQTIRVKPPSKFVSSGLFLNQEPIVQRLSSAPSEKKAERSRTTSQQVPEPRGLRVMQVPERMDVLSYPFQNRQTDRLNQVQTLTGTEIRGGPESASTPRTDPQSADLSQNVRPPTSRTSYQNNANSPANVRVHQTNTARPFAGGSGGPDLHDPTSDCTHEYGHSVHEGIIRGQRSS